jgi:hypothetical protein
MPVPAAVTSKQLLQDLPLYPLPFLLPDFLLYAGPLPRKHLLLYPLPLHAIYAFPLHAVSVLPIPLLMLCTLYVRCMPIIC